MITETFSVMLITNKWIVVMEINNTLCLFMAVCLGVFESILLISTRNVLPLIFTSNK